MKTDWNTELAEEMYSHGKSTYKIAEEVTVSRATVRKYIKRHSDVDLRGPAKYDSEIKDNIFKDPNNEAKYWIGFIMADGSVSDHKLQVGLQERDKQHLERLKSFLNLKKDLYYRKTKETKQNQYVLEATSTRMIKHLNSYGIIKRKVDGTRVKKLQHDRHFWRGMIDGDGTVNKPSRHTIIGLYGCYKIIEQFKSWTQNFVTSDTEIRQCHENTYSHRINGKNAYKILKKLYCDQEVALERKERRAFSHLGCFDYTKDDELYNPDHTLKDK